MAKILNNILCTAMIFAITFLWTYYGIKDATVAAVLSLVVALCSSYLLYRALSKWESAKNAKKQRKKAVNDFAEYLKYGENNAKLFAELFEYYNYAITPIDYDNFIATKNGKYFVAVCFEQNALTQDELRKAVVCAKRNKADKLFVLAAKIDQPFVKAANARITTTFLDAANAYELLEQCDKLPQIPSARKTQTGFVAKYAFNRKRFGWYMLSSLFMLVISVVSYFPWYTLSWATVMLALALYCLLNKRFNPTRTAVSID